jgi:hypothetical protein
VDFHTADFRKPLQQGFRCCAETRLPLPVITVMLTTIRGQNRYSHKKTASEKDRVVDLGDS